VRARILIAAATAVALLAPVTAGRASAATAAGEETSAPAGTQELPPGVPMTLDEAVATAFAHDPKLATAAAQVSGRGGSLLQAQGLFAHVFDVRTSLDYRASELVGGRLQNEKDRRLRLEIPPPILEDVAQKLVDRLPVAFGDKNPGSLLFPDCTQATSYFILRDDATDAVQSVLCFDADGNLLGILGAPATSDQVLNALNLTGLFDDLSGIDQRLDNFVHAQLGLAADEMRTIAIALRQAADALRLQRSRLGALPVDLQTLRFDLAFDLQHKFRTGASLVSTVDFASSEDNYLGKTLLPPYGDSFVPNNFLATFGLSLDLPLGRGGGRASAQAPLLAAQRNLSAARLLYRHTAALRALAAAQAYWDVAASERRLAILQDSQSIQEQLLSAGEELVKADVIPAVDIYRNQAQLAQVSGQVDSARQALAVARLALVRAIGLGDATLDRAPQAAQGLEEWVAADPLAGAQPADLVSRALANREDLKASGSLVAANAALLAGAKSDLKPQVDLSFNLSYNAFYETFFHRFYEPEGWARALNDKFAGPTYGIALKFQLPIGNHQAEGRLLQAQATDAQGRISEADLKRTIRLRVSELAETVARARAELDAQRATLAAIVETQQAAIERYKAGDLSVIDTLTTEQQRTGAELQLVDAERRYLSLVAQLRFETGSLVDIPEDESGSLGGARLRPLGEPVL
jgi:outer membrane protein TolC